MALNVVLERDGHDQPWGFRLQGGVDVGMPLSVQRVLVGTPAETVLKRGDLVTKIGNTNTQGLTHQQAADLFSITGNSIGITVKRSATGAPLPSQPTVSSLQASAANRQQQQQQANAVQSPQVAALPRTTFAPKPKFVATPPAPKVAVQEKLSIKQQPYRTLPLIQPSVKALDLGIGSYNQLKKQEKILSAVKVLRFAPIVQVAPVAKVTPVAQVAPVKINQLLLKKKTQQGLLNAASAPKPAEKVIPSKGPIVGPVPVKLPPSPSVQGFGPTIQPAKYNSAGGLYCQSKTSATGMINPARTPSGNPPTGPLQPPKEFNPAESATWRYLLESEAPPDIDKTKNYTAMNEHTPIYSEVYEVPKVPAAGQRPIKPGTPKVGVSALAPKGGPVARDGSPSHVQVAALSQESAGSRGRSPKSEAIPLYETNSIGGRKRISQSSSFNKLMMNVLGE